MTKELKGIIKGLTTLFFQEGFNRNEHKHGLDYWVTDLDESLTHSRFVECYRDDEDDYTLRLNVVKLNDKYFVRPYLLIKDEYGDVQDETTLVLIPVSPNRLCWEGVVRCAEHIEIALGVD